MKIYIFGTGDLARDLFCLIKDLNRSGKSYQFSGFISKPGETEQVRIGQETFQSIDESKVVELSQNACFAMGMGDPKVIAKLAKKFSTLEFPNLIHPSAIADWETISLGRGNVITAGNVFTTGLKFGDFNYINNSCTIGHDTIIGSYNVINPGARVSGKVVIGDACLLGTNSTVLQGLKIESGVTLGACALATKDILSAGTYIGIPAKEMKR